MKWAGVDSQPISPEDPEANGMAENFIKVIEKAWQSALVEKKNPPQELYKRNYIGTRRTLQLERAQRRLCLVGPLKIDFHKS